MEHILQRQLLRRPLTCVYYGPPWDVTDLDGGCDIWHRFQEKRLPSRRLPLRLEKTYRKEVEQFEKTLEKEAMAKSMWEQRAKDNADREGWWMDTRAIGNSNTGTVEDDADEDEDEDEDEYSTIYSCARRDPPASHKVFSSNLPSTSISSDDSHATAPCTLETMSLVYHSFDWGDDVEDAEWAGMQSTHTQPVLTLTTANDAAHQLAFMEFLTQYVHQSWSQYEKQRQMQVVDKNRTLDVKKRIPGGVLSICDWNGSPFPTATNTMRLTP
jgi:hypothetical protein